MEKLLLMPQQAKFFSKRAERKNAYDIIIAFNAEETFDITRFDDEVNKALTLTKVGFLRMSAQPYLADTFTSYKTAVLDGNEIPKGDLSEIADQFYLKATGEIDVSAGRFIVGYLAGGHLFLIFNHLVFDLEGVYSFFDEISHIIKYQPVNCSSNPNELARLIATTADSLSNEEVENPWAGKDINNFMVEIDYPNPVESDMIETTQVMLLDPQRLSEIELKLVSPTNGKHKGMMYLLFGALLSTNYRVSGNPHLFGHFNHTYTGIPGFSRFTNIITWKVAGVPFIFDHYRPGDEHDIRSYLGKIKAIMDVLFNEGYKMDILRQRNFNPELIKKLDSPILLFNYRSDMIKMEKKAKECGLELIERGYDYVPRLFSYAARHLFDLNFNNHLDGLYLTVEYSSKNYSEAFVENFIRLFKEEYDSLTDRCNALPDQDRFNLAAE